MSLTSTDIIIALSDGLYFSKGDREFTVRLDQHSDTLIVNEMSGLRRHTLQVESILDAARATREGSQLEDSAALRALLSGFSWS